MNFKNFMMIPVIAMTVLVIAASGVTLRAQQLPMLGTAKVEDIVKAMSLEEKVSLVVGTGMYIPGSNFPGMNAEPGEAQKRVPGASGGIFAIPRLGVPGVAVTDGPAGVHVFNIGVGRIYYSTAWPSGTLLASTWDTTLVKKVGSAFGGEAKEYGIDVVLGPGMNIHRNPLGARNFEYYSEDPLVSGRIASAMVKGIQSKGVGTSVKHFAANNQETNRSTVNTVMSERTLREIYLRGWEIVVKDAKPWTIMSSYNKINGPYTSESIELLTNILRKEWDYDGLVMTDWFGGTDAVAQMKAGNNLLMPGKAEQRTAILAAVKSGQLSEAILDSNVTAVLNLILKTPTFSRYKFSDQPDLNQNAQLSREAAGEGMVLLKNGNNVLPLKKHSLIAAFGNHAFDLIAGGTGSGETKKLYTVSLVEGLFNSGFVISPELVSMYSDYLAAERRRRPKKTFLEEFVNPSAAIPEMEITDEVIKLSAKNSDVAMITIGRQAGEGTDRKVENDYYLTTGEKKMISRVADAFHQAGKAVVIVLNVGGVIDVSEWRDQVDGILLAWQPGLEGGNAMADVLSGKTNPSGKLATTFPASYKDVPSANSFPGKEFKDKPVAGMMGMPAYEAEVVYDEGIYVGYRYYATFNVKPAYEFGYGLSYTEFSYNNLQLSSKDFSNTMAVAVTVKNTGTVAGKEVVQLYLSAPASKLDKPKLELKGFAKTKLLQPGESQTVNFILKARDLSSYDAALNAWIADKGTYTVSIGTSSNAKLSGTFSLKKTSIVEKTSKALAPLVQVKELRPPGKK